MSGRRRANQPATIKGAGFDGNTGLSQSDWKKLIVPSPTDAPRHLLDAWEGKLMGFCSMTLDNNNASILNARFNLAGTLWDQKDHTVGAHRLWEDVENGTTLSFPALNTNIFTFNSGTLVSDLIGHEQIKHAWRVDNNAADTGKEFTIRAYVAPSEEFWATLWLILYPLAKQELLDSYPLAANSSFPGLKLASLHFRLGLQSSAILGDIQWGSPLVPAIVSPSDWTANQAPPSTAALRQAMASTLRTAIRPEIKKNHATLLTRWNEIADQGERALKTLLPPDIWPASDARPPPRGKAMVLSFFLLQQFFLHNVFSFLC